MEKTIVNLRGGRCLTISGSYDEITARIHKLRENVKFIEVGLMTRQPGGGEDEYDIHRFILNLDCIESILEDGSNG